LSPINKKNDLAEKLTRQSLNTLAGKIQAEKEVGRLQNATLIQTLESHINHLAAIIENNESNVQDDKIMFERGVLTELEYRQSSVEYNAKCLLLKNYNDDLWLCRFLEAFYF
jgi:hypothetical protein